jgi:hypothetical protein
MEKLVVRTALFITDLLPRLLGFFLIKTAFVQSSGAALRREEQPAVWNKRNGIYIRGLHKDHTTCLLHIVVPLVRNIFLGPVWTKTHLLL